MEKLLKFNSEQSIREKIKQLKQSDGEGWAVGDFVERELYKHLGGRKECQEN